MTTTSPPITLSAEDQQRLAEIDAIAAGGADAVPRLIEALSDPSWAVRRGVVAALGRLGDPAVQPLCDVLRGSATTRHASPPRWTPSSRAAGTSKARSRRSPSTPTPPSSPTWPRCSAAAGATAPSPPHPAHVARGRQRLGRRDRGARPRRRPRCGGLARRDGPGRQLLPHLPGDRRARRSRSERRRAARTLLRQPVLRARGRARPRPDRPGRRGRAARGTAPPGARRDRPRRRGRDRRDPRLDRDAIRRPARGSSALPGLRLAAGRHPPARAQRLRRLEDEQRAHCRVLAWMGARRRPPRCSRSSTRAPRGRRALQSVGAEVDAQIIAALRRGDSARRLLLLPLIVGRSSAGREAVACLDDQDPAVRASACDALTRIGTRPPFPRCSACSATPIPAWCTRS